VVLSIVGHIRTAFQLAQSEASAPQGHARLAHLNALPR
jgi:hypothetical protein